MNLFNLYQNLIVPPIVIKHDLGTYYYPPTRTFPHATCFVPPSSVIGTYLRAIKAKVESPALALTLHTTNEKLSYCRDREKHSSKIRKACQWGEKPLRKDQEYRLAVSSFI